MNSQERQQTAREMHDALGHSFTVVGVQLQALEELLIREHESTLEALGKAQRVNAQGLEELRRILGNLTRSPVESQDFLKSIQVLVATTQQPHFHATFEQADLYRRIPALTELALYRFFQEGLSNVCRHAQATTATLHLSFPSLSHVAVSLSDNGRGMQAGTGSGLAGLLERAVLLGGTFTTGLSTTGGTLLEMILPT
jgi:signal transduction histidine kinase